MSSLFNLAATVALFSNTSLGSRVLANVKPMQRPTSSRLTDTLTNTVKPTCATAVTTRLFKAFVVFLS